MSFFINWINFTWTISEKELHMRTENWLWGLLVTNSALWILKIRYPDLHHTQLIGVSTPSSYWLWTFGNSVQDRLNGHLSSIAFSLSLRLPLCLWHNPPLQTSFACIRNHLNPRTNTQTARTSQGIFPGSNTGNYSSNWYHHIRLTSLHWGQVF